MDDSTKATKTGCYDMSSKPSLVPSLVPSYGTVGSASSALLLVFEATVMSGKDLGSGVEADGVSRANQTRIENSSQLQQPVDGRFTSRWAICCGVQEDGKKKFFGAEKNGTLFSVHSNTVVAIKAATQTRIFTTPNLNDFLFSCGDAR